MMIATRSIIIIIILLVVVAAAVVIALRLRSGRRNEAFVLGEDAMKLAPSRFKSHGRTHYYQMPPGGAPKGLLFVTPGCARWGPGFWPRSKSCPECVGLPEDVCHSAQALLRGYAIFVAWPVDRAFPGQYCWSAKDDYPSLVQILREFLASQPSLKGKPIYAMGASSGGSMALRLPGKARAAGLRIDGVVAEVATKAEVSDIVQGLSGGKYPPIVWVTMGGNRTEVNRGRQRARDYAKYGPSAVAVSQPKPVTDTFFSDRMAGITEQQSAQLTAAMKRAGLLRQDGTFAKDPKKDKAWTGAIKRELPWVSAFPLGPVKKSAILQALMLAQSNHEHVCEFLTAALAWFEQGGRGSFDDMVARHAVAKPASLFAPQKSRDNSIDSDAGGAEEVVGQEEDAAAAE